MKVPDGTPGVDELPAAESRPLAIGTFGSTATGTSWQVMWHPGTGEVTAAPEVSTPTSTGQSRVLGMVPDLLYLTAIVSAIDDAKRGSSLDWRQTSGIEALSAWLNMVSAALAGDLVLPHDEFERHTTPRYVDLGHTCQQVDKQKDGLLAIELWASLEELRTLASAALADLDASLAGEGNIARAATAAQSLAEHAISLHVALADGYRLAHETAPGKAPTSAEL